MDTPSDELRRAGVPRWRNLMVLVVVAGLAFLAASPMLYELLIAVFGPPTVTMREAYVDGRRGARFDHGPFDAVLRGHVDADGWVDYDALWEDSSELDRYVESLARAPFDAMSRDEKLALLINAYNAFTIRLMLDHWPVDSIRNIPAAERWDDVRWQIGEMRLSLTSIEHDFLRTRFVEPRIHFAINCASIGCPPLRSEAFLPHRLDEQLDDQMRRTHRESRWFQFDPATGRLGLTSIYRWYSGDFRQASGSLVDWIREHSVVIDRFVEDGGRLRVWWLDYDWRANVG